MARTLVIGAGMGGLTTAVLLALDGHDVTVVERDPDPPPDDVDAAWARWERRGVNQFRLPHFTMARWRALIEQELPEVVVELEGRGAIRYDPMAAMPAELTGGVRDGDDRFVSLTARRPVLEAAVAAAAARTYGLTVRRGVGVAGLLTGEPVGGDAPHVIGIRTEDGEDLTADLVVDCSGRRSALPRWLEAIGARSPLEELEDSGFQYFGRHFRADEGHPDVQVPLLQQYDSVSILTLPADNGTWSTTFVASSGDRALRGLRDPEVWTAAMSRYPLAADWIDGEPISGVDAITRIEDRHRSFVVDGEPVATGVVAVGDAWACTNPSLGRGTTIGLVQAIALRDLLREVEPSEPDKLARRWDEVTEEVVEPLYRATLTFDRHRLAEVVAQREGRVYQPDDPTWAVSRAFSRAALQDPDLLRHFSEVTAVLALPDEVTARPGVLERVLEVGGDGAEPALLPGPDRAELVATIAEANGSEEVR